MFKIILEKNLKKNLLHRKVQTILKNKFKNKINLNNFNLVRNSEKN